MTAVTDTTPTGANDTAVGSSTRPYYWSVRRELWENRAIIIAPISAAGLVLFGFVIAMIKLAHTSDLADWSNHHLWRGAAFAIPYHIASAAVIVTGVIVAMFYCLGALHNERRDRSILFWKSLPVSDLTTVMAKATIPMLVMPAVVLVTIMATHLVMLLLNTAVLAAHGADASAPWTQIPWGQMYLVLPYGLVVLALWFAPVFAWLLLVSGWARRAPFLWAVLPPLALCIVEKIALDTSFFWDLIQRRLNGAFSEAFSAGMPHAGDMPHSGDMMPQIDAGRFLTSPDVWVGLIVAGAFTAAAIWFRRYREPV